MNNNFECKAKILDTKEQDLQSQLIELNFERSFEGEIKTQWLRNPFNGEELRVREMDSIVDVKHWQRLVENRIFLIQELGFETTAEFEKVIMLQCALGMERMGLQSVKKRVSWILSLSETEHICLNFDTYTVLNGNKITETKEFLGIKAPTADRIFSAVERLHLDPANCKGYGFQELFDHHFLKEKTI